jgi:hypothetical protein
MTYNVATDLFTRAAASAMLTGISGPPDGFALMLERDCFTASRMNEIL